MAIDNSLRLTAREITAMFAEDGAGKRFPPILTLNQAAELLQVPAATIRDWRSRNLLTGCCRRAGRHLRFSRDRLIERVFNEGLREN